MTNADIVESFGGGFFIANVLNSVFLGVAMIEE